MKVKQMLAYLKQQSDRSASLFEQEVFLRVEGRDYAIRSIDSSTSAVVFWGGEDHP